MAYRKFYDDVGPGWRSIVEEALPAIEAKGGFIMQVKEKFGGLRIYSHAGDFDAISDIVRKAESEAEVTCEKCGDVGSLRNNDGWMKTLCDRCNKRIVDRDT